MRAAHAGNHGLPGAVAGERGAAQRDRCDLTWVGVSAPLLLLLCEPEAPAASGLRALGPEPGVPGSFLAIRRATAETCARGGVRVVRRCRRASQRLRAAFWASVGPGEGGGKRSVFLKKAMLPTNKYLFVFVKKLPSKLCCSFFTKSHDEFVNFSFHK